jgi:hypothetical protein
LIALSWRTNGAQYREPDASPFGLLQIAEIIGGADWSPARMAFGETLAGPIAEVPEVDCVSPPRSDWSWG